MSINISDYLTTAVQRFYGVDVSSEKQTALWNEFYAKIPPETKDYLTVVSSSSVNISDVRAAVSNIMEAAIMNMNMDTLPDGIVTPSLQSQEVQDAITQIAVKLVTLRNDPALAGLNSTDPSVVNATIQSLCSSLSPSPSLIELLSRAAAAIATRGASLPTQYIQFLSDKVAATDLSAATSALSSHEEEIRRIMFEIFSLALDMIRVLQNTAQLEANLMAYYTAMQKEYADMVSRLQIYGPTRSMRITANSDDFGNTTLGYDNITIRNIADYLLTKFTTTSGAETVSYSSQASNPTTSTPYAGPVDNYNNPSPLKFVLSREADGGYSFEIQGYQATISGGILSTGYYTFLSTKWISADGSDYSAASPEVTNHLYYESSTLQGNKQTADLLNKMMYHLTKQWNDTPSSTLGPNGYIINYIVGGPASYGTLKNVWSPSYSLNEPFNIYFKGPSQAWETTTSDDQEDIDAAKGRASSFRSETNAVLQTYVETANTYKQFAKDAATRAESTLTTIKESIQNQEDFVSAIVESLRGLLSAIYR